MIYDVYVTWCIEIHQTSSPWYFFLPRQKNTSLLMMSSWDGGSLRDCSRSAQAQGVLVFISAGSFFGWFLWFFFGFLWVFYFGWFLCFFWVFLWLIYAFRRNRFMSFYEFLWHSLVFNGLWWKCTWEWDTSPKPRRIGWCKEAIALVIDVEWRKRIKKGYPIFRQTHMLRAFAHRKLWFNQSSPIIIPWLQV